MHSRIRIKTNTDILYISKTKIDDDFRPIEHSHPNVEILFVNENDGKIITTNDKIRIKKGNLIIINPNIKHKEISNNKLDFYAIGLNMSNIININDYKEKIMILNLDNKEADKIKNVYNAIYDEANNKELDYENIIDNYLNNLLVFIKRYKLLYLSNVDKSDSDLVFNIKNIIDNNYTLPLRLDELANRLSISKSTLCHKFYNETKTSIIKYKLNKQLEEAKNLLNISDMSISQISFLVGFNNTSYFNKLFKQYYGITPHIYKQNKDI